MFYVINDKYHVYVTLINRFIIFYSYFIIYSKNNIKNINKHTILQ